MFYFLHIGSIHKTKVTIIICVYVFVLEREKVKMVESCFLIVKRNDVHASCGGCFHRTVVIKVICKY